jgi:hypothetical protein
MDDNPHRYEIKPIATYEFAGEAVPVWGLHLVANLLPPGKTSARRYIFIMDMNYDDHSIPLEPLFGGVPCFLNALLRAVIAERESAFITLSQPIEFFDRALGSVPAFTVEIGSIIAIEIQNSQDKNNIYSFRRYFPKVAVQLQPPQVPMGDVVNRYEMHPIAIHESCVGAQYWVVVVGRLARHRERRYVFWIIDDLSRPQPKFEGVPSVLSTLLQGIVEEKGSVYVTLSDSIENLDKLAGMDSVNDSYSYTPKWIDGITEIEIPNPHDSSNVFIYRAYVDKVGE